MGMKAYLAKVHGFYTFTTQRRTDGRTRTCLTSSNNEFDNHILYRARFRHVDGEVCTDSKIKLMVDIRKKFPGGRACRSDLGFSTRGFGADALIFDLKLETTSYINFYYQPEDLLFIQLLHIPKKI
jgi:hypothetical protein